MPIQAMEHINLCTYNDSIFNINMVIYIEENYFEFIIGGQFL